MANLVDELESIINYIAPHFPDKTFERQNIPSSPQPNTFFIRFQRTDGLNETSGVYVNSRMWEFIYAGSDVVDVLSTMDILARRILSDGCAIPLLDTKHYLRARYFNFSQPFVNENDTNMIIGIARIDSRDLIEKPAATKVTEVQINKDGEIIAERKEN